QVVFEVDQQVLPGTDYHSDPLWQRFPPYLQSVGNVRQRDSVILLYKFHKIVCDRTQSLLILSGQNNQLWRDGIHRLRLRPGLRERFNHHADIASARANRIDECPVGNSKGLTVFLELPRLPLHQIATQMKGRVFHLQVWIDGPQLEQGYYL